MLQAIRLTMVGMFLLMSSPARSELARALVAQAVPPASQQAPGAGPQKEPGALTIEGTLTKIDAKGRLIWIKAADGKEMQVTYTERTQIVGAGESAEGLAGRSGSQLRVSYQILAGVNVAIKIEVLPTQAALPSVLARFGSGSRS